MLSALRCTLSGGRSAFAPLLIQGGKIAPRRFSETVGNDGSHDDFKPQTRDAGTAVGVFDTIKEDISKNRVFVYMKGVPEAPMCGFSMTVCRVLDAYGAKYGSRNVLEDPELREGVKKFSNWPTIPQVYVDGVFVGGCDILMQMHENGELSGVLESS